MKDTLPYYLGFSYCYGVGPVTFTTLIDTFKTVEQAYNASLSDLIQVIDVKKAKKFDQFRKKFDLSKALQKIEQNKITILTKESPLYPVQLVHFRDAPICLYVKGDLDLIDFNYDCLFAIVGTRKASDYGLTITRQFARELTEAGFIIISGMALGIDAAAHKAALNVGGKTVAVFGCSIDKIYPYANREIYNTILNGKGVVISEFPPGFSGMPGMFISRNRLISGLSKGVFVVEGLEDSGSLATVRHAADQGVNVYAPSLPIDLPSNVAVKIAINSGGKLVTSVEDILQDFGIKKKDTSRYIEKIKSLSDQERKVLDLLNQMQSADDLSRKLDLPITQVLSLLSSLEINGVVQRTANGKYQLQ